MSEFATITLSLTAAAFWGAGDFTGGITTKRVDVFGVVIVAHFAGLLLLIALGILSGEVVPSLADLLWSTVAGVAGGIGITAFYRGLAVGRMGIVAPLTGVLATAIPVVFAAVTLGLPQPVQVIGFGLALVSVYLISRTTEATSARESGISYGLLAALGFGGFLIMIDQVEGDSFFWILAAARAGSSVFMLLTATALRRDWMPERHHFLPILLVGLLDLGGNAFYVLAIQEGRIDVAAVLSSLYPAVTILLARVILHERMTTLQVVGIVAALAAIALIAL